MANLLQGQDSSVSEPKMRHSRRMSIIHSTISQAPMARYILFSTTYMTNWVLLGDGRNTLAFTTLPGVFEVAQHACA